MRSGSKTHPKWNALTPTRPSRAAFGSRRSAGGFTLIEMMIVIGLIIILIGGFGFALRDTAGSALTRAQNTLGALVGQARAQAALNQTEARLVIYATRPPGGDNSKYLRLLQVFVATTQGSTNSWVPVGSPTYLPSGVYLVPTATNGLLASGVSWLTNPPPISTPLGTAGNPNQPNGTAFFGASTVFYIEFKADGSFVPAANPFTKLVVTTGALGTNNLPAFNNPNAVRGIRIRSNGAISYVNEATGF